MNSLFLDPCENITCPGTGECAPTASCVLGQCVPIHLPDNTLCNGNISICSAGACVDPCSTVSCTASSPCQEAYCVAEAGAHAVCRERPKADGMIFPVIYPPRFLLLSLPLRGAPPPVPTFVGLVAASANAVCQAGDNRCQAPLRYLPRISLPPPLTPFVNSSIHNRRSVLTNLVEKINLPSNARSKVAVPVARNFKMEACHEGITAISHLPCRCEESCLTCLWTAGVAKGCKVCSNGTALLQSVGACVAQCPDGSLATPNMHSRGSICAPIQDRISEGAASAKAVRAASGVTGTSVNVTVIVVGIAVVALCIAAALLVTRRREVEHILPRFVPNNGFMSLEEVCVS
jgi:hypothetical protein